MENIQIETGLSQQPMSLITINSNINNKRIGSTNDENLLTIRILEASERKMQLIKKLLSPEEFDSIASELQNAKQDVRYLQQKKQIAATSDELFSGSIPVQFKDSTDNFKEQKFDKRLSKSESNIRANCNFNLHDNISRKREGLEFFFSESDNENPIKIVQESRDLAIELRSGYYMNSSSSSSEEENGSENVLRNFGFSLKDRINGLLNYLNLSSLNIFSIEEDEEFERSQFIKLNRNYNRGPHTSKRNLLKMNKRLKAEKEFAKVNNLTQKMFEMTRTSVGQRRIEDVKESNLDRNYRVMVDFNSIGHSFSSLKSMSSKQFESVELFDILNYPQSFKCFTRHRRQNRLNLASNETLATNHKVLNLSLSSMEVIKHSFMLLEESLAIKLLNCQSKINKLQDVFDCITDRLIEIIDMMDFNRNLLDEVNKKRLKAMLDLRSKVLMNQLKTLENKLREMFSELESVRKQQNFISTGVLMCHHNDVEEERKIRNKLFKDSLGKLIKLMGSDEKRTVDDKFKEFLEQQTKLDFVRTVYRIDELGSQITDNNRCPREEYQRRLNLKRWLRSLRIRILFGDKFFQECTIQFQIPNYFIKLNLNENSFHVPIPVNESELTMKIEISTRRHSLIPFYQDLIATSKNKLVISGVKSIDIVKFQFLDKQTEINMNFHRSVEEPKSSKTRFSYCARQLVDTIYKKTFITSTIFDDLNIKIFKLLNQTDLRYLILFLLNHNNPVVTHFNSSFTLDPYLDNFVEEGRLEDKDNNGSKRRALLVWRWLNNINQTVYMSDRENNKYHDLNKLQEIDSKLKLISATKLESGYKAIEQIRLWASDYIKKYESHLNEILQFNNREILNQQQQNTTKLRDLLQEPRIKIDLSGLMNMNYKFVPRRTARRPLMPKRSKKGIFSGKNIQQDLVQQESSGDKSETLDLESQIFDHWQRFTSRMRFSHKLQLVVTIQQANNLPMRVMQQQSATTRPNTPQPFATATTTATTTAPATVPSISPSNFFNLPSSNIGSPPTTLAPPTSYVEVIFQRKQQASSLVYGKNPNWHETLFFPVDVPKMSYLNNGSPLNFHLDGDDTNTNTNNNTNENINLKSHSQLVDEFLQLNLYDYNCYLHNDDTMMINSHQLPTLPLTSRLEALESSLGGGSGGGLLDSSLQSNRMLASRQRIERHLLGSLRIPLKTLLSTGRIEGSFALNQPLFMENYQFEPEQTNNSIINTQNQQARESNFKRNNKFETYISLFITLDPPISIPFYLYLSTGSHESEQIFEYAKLWERTISQYKKRASKQRSTNHLQGSSAINLGSNHHIRHVRAIVLQLDAKYCLVSRLITPLEPPKELLIEDGGENKRKVIQMKTLARFVSLLSPLKYGLFNMRLLESSLWFDSAQLINKCLGGIEEKAVLLCNYFLHLGHCSAILLGDAIPEGRCAYVIVWHEQSRLLDEQLQLNADNLLESLGGEQISSAPANNKQQSEPVMSQNFLLNLPILINSKTVHLWDPNSGKSYTLNNPLQLVSVGSIVTCENVYANIQAVGSVTGTNFDIRLRNFWFPLFEASSQSSQSRLGDNFRKNYLKKTNQMNLRRQLVELEETRRLIGKVVIKPIIRDEFVQLNYDKLTEEQCKHLEDSIDRAIKAQLLKWRPNRPTYFNRTLSRHLAEKLKLFERYSIEANSSNNSSNDQQTVDWKSELADLIRNEILMPHISSNGLNARQVVSWPMNLSFTSMKTILDSLYASGVHNADVMLESASSWNTNRGVTTSTQPLPISSNTQFLVACHAHAYPARVVSVWLYVAAVITQNRPLLN